MTYMKSKSLISFQPDLEKPEGFYVEVDEIKSAVSFTVMTDYDDGGEFVQNPVTHILTAEEVHALYAALSTHLGISS